MADLPEDPWGEATPAAPTKEEQPAVALPEDPWDVASRSREAAGVYERETARARESAQSDFGRNAAGIRYVASRALPIVGAGLGASLEYRARNARARIESGTAQPGDFDTTAQHEQQQRMGEQANATFGGQLAHAAASLPAIVGETAVAGGLLGRVAPRLAQAGGIGGIVGRQVVTTPLMPSFYLDDWQHRGGSAADLLKAIGNGMMANVVLGGVGAAAGTGRTLLGGVSRGAGTMIGGSAIADQLSQWLHLSEHGGTIQQIREGKYGEAAQHALIQGLTGAAFSLMHGRPEEARQTVDEVVQRAAEHASTQESERSPSAPPAEEATSRPPENAPETPQVQEPPQQEATSTPGEPPGSPETAPESSQPRPEPPSTAEPPKPAETPPALSGEAEHTAESVRGSEQSGEHRPWTVEEQRARRQALLSEIGTTEHEAEQRLQEEMRQRPAEPPAHPAEAEPAAEPRPLDEIYDKAGLTTAEREAVSGTAVEGQSQRSLEGKLGSSHTTIGKLVESAKRKLKPFQEELLSRARIAQEARAEPAETEKERQGTAAEMVGGAKYGKRGAARVHEENQARRLRDAERLRQREASSAPGKPGEPHYRVEGEGRPLTAEEKRLGMFGGGQDNATSAEQRTPPPRETALANEVIDKERESRGLPPLLKSARESFGEAWDRAMGMVEADPGLPERLVKELIDKPRPTTREESAILLREKVSLSNAQERSIREWMDAERRAGPRMDKPTREAFRARDMEYTERMDRLDEAVRKAGSELGWNLAFRRQLAAEDYSLGGLLRRAELNKKSPLTEAERAEIERLQAQLKAALDRLAAAESGEKPAAPDGQPEDMTDLRVQARTRRTAMDAHIKAFKKFNEPLHEKALTGAKEGLSFTRSLITSLDLSSVFRQGGFLAFAHPVRASKAIPEMLRSLVSEHDYQRAHQQILDRPNAKLYQEAGLYIADMHGQAEEGYAGRFTHVGNTLRKYLLINASERAYTAFLNRVRADSFDSLASTLGLHGAPNKTEAQAIANYINVATGRGSLGRQGEKAAELLSNTFFSPRFVASRFQLLAGQPLYQGSAATRRLIALEYGRYLLGLGAFYGLTKLLLGDEAKVKFDPRSSDFGKIILNHTRVDPLSGLSQNLVFVSRLMSGQTKSTKNEQVSNLRGPRRFGASTVPDVIERFIRSKLAPIPGLVTDLAAGENVVGEPVTAGSAIAGLTIPLALRDTYQAMKDLGATKGTAASMLGILGMGLQTYQQKPRHYLGAR